MLERNKSFIIKKTKKLFTLILLMIFSASMSVFAGTPPSAPGVPTTGVETRQSSVVWFSWDKASDNDNDINYYLLQVGTIPDGADIYDEIIRLTITDPDDTTLTYAVDVSGLFNQTVYARVAAVDKEGNQGTWSSVSSGVTITDPLLAPATLYVRTYGDDSNNGLSESTAFRTISTAATVVQAGDIVDVGPGVYKEQVNIPSGGTEEAPIVFRGNGEAILEGSEPLSDWTNFGLYTTGPVDCKLWGSPFNPNDHAHLFDLDSGHYAPMQAFIDGEQLQTRPSPISFENNHAIKEDDSQSMYWIKKQLTPGSWFWLDDRHGDYANYVGVCLDPADDINNHLIEIPFRNAGFFSTEGHLQIDGFEIRRPAIAGIAISGKYYTEDIVVSNNVIHHVSGKRQVTPDDLPDSFIWQRGQGISVRVKKRAYIAGNRVTDVSYMGIQFFINNWEPVSKEGFLYVKDNIVQGITPHPFGVNRAHEGGEAIGGANGAKYNIIEDNYVSDARFGIWFDSSLKNTSTIPGSHRGTGNTLVWGNTLQNVRTAIFFERSIFESLAARNLVIGAQTGVKLGTWSQYGQEPFPQIPVYASRDNRVINNTFVDTAVGVDLSYAINPVLQNNISALYNDLRLPVLTCVSSMPQQDYVGVLMSHTMVNEPEMYITGANIGHSLYDMEFNSYPQYALSASIACEGNDPCHKANCMSALSDWKNYGNYNFGVGSFAESATFRDPQDLDQNPDNNYMLDIYSYGSTIAGGIDAGLGDYCDEWPEMGAYEHPEHCQ